MKTRVSFPISVATSLVAAFLVGAQPIFANELDLSPEIRENSPVLHRWLEEIPDVLEEIKHKPRFSSRFRLGYSVFPSIDDSQGWLLGVEDVGLNQGKLTFSADYQYSPSGEYQSLGAGIQYYIRPLGKYINLAPVLGYRYIQTGDYSTSGINIGAKLVLALSSQGAADVFVSQNFIFSGDGEQVGITTVSLGYALTSKLRISTDVEQLNSIAIKDSRLAVILELLR